MKTLWPDISRMLFLAVALVVVLMTGHAAAARCDADSIRLEFVLEDRRSKVTLDHSKSSAELDELSAGLMGKEFSQRLKAEAANVNMNLLRVKLDGLTYGPAAGNLRLFFYHEDLGDGSYCVYIQKMFLKFGFKEMNIYIVNKISKDSCRYESVLAHEQEHVRRSNNVLTDFLPTFQNLNDYAVLISGRHGADIDTLRQGLLDDVAARLGDMGVLFDKALKVENNKIDTFENYRRLEQQCPAGKVVKVTHTVPSSEQAPQPIWEETARP
jgi:hypothetical protein